MSASSEPKENDELTVEERSAQDCAVVWASGTILGDAALGGTSGGNAAASDLIGHASGGCSSSHGEPSAPSPLNHARHRVSGGSAVRSRVALIAALDQRLAAIDHERVLINGLLDFYASQDANDTSRGLP